MDTNVNYLHPVILKWLNRQGWTHLHDIQEKAILPILRAQDDIIISAATASGKTEAAFLPACTAILSKKLPGVRIIYISPLKALINDQYKRINALGEATGIPVTPWHGDISSSHKKNLFQLPEGIILITPESLESLLINHQKWCKEALKNLSYFIIDEFHAFIGTERGYQLLSQLHRIEFLQKKQIPRIALSATLSNIQSVKQWLRPNAAGKTEIIESSAGSKGIKLQIRGYDIQKSPSHEEESRNYDYLARDIFRLLRGSTNLVFANSRNKTELIAGSLTRLCQDNFVPVEFFPHHSSLSKDLRERLENRLKEGRLPTTAICTQTLELGIDIGDIASIGQINSPQSVASLRQRIGRSGRRDKDAVLRIFIPEVGDPDNDKPALHELLRDETFASAAMIELVLSRWFEPPTRREYALSTLTQQVLAITAQYGSVQAKSLYRLLCKTGPFSLVDPGTFAELLRSLGSHELLTQMGDGCLTLGIGGEKLLSNYNFYSAFKVQEEYTIDNDGQKIGTIPLNQPLEVGDTFLFAGKGWEVIFLSDEKHEIYVKSCKEDAEPLIIDGNGGRIHDGVREKMLELYTSQKPLPYLNRAASKHFEEGREHFQALNLFENRFIVGINGIYLLPWKGDRIMQTIVQILKKHDIPHAKKIGSAIFIPRITSLKFKDTVQAILNTAPPHETELAKTVGNLEFEKYDRFLSRELLQKAYGFRNFDVPGAMEFFKTVIRESHSPFDPANGASYPVY
ncbi:DEAD/DEAH box helicase [Succinimonas sp.]|uniref:DEAD/DEAH box helicase n=1 Tax=Succinimonas sp. TaxID=1936151 RepID=UPI00386FF7C1